jgi:hypothetical protein
VPSNLLEDATSDGTTSPLHDAAKRGNLGNGNNEHKTQTFITGLRITPSFTMLPHLFIVRSVVNWEKFRPQNPRVAA